VSPSSSDRPDRNASGTIPVLRQVVSVSLLRVAIAHRFVDVAVVVVVAGVINV